jgi:hypothetical protein
MCSLNHGLPESSGGLLHMKVDVGETLLLHFPLTACFHRGGFARFTVIQRAELGQEASSSWALGKNNHVDAHEGIVRLRPTGVNGSSEAVLSACSASPRRLLAMTF